MSYTWRWSFRNETYRPRLNATGEIIISQKGLSSKDITIHADCRREITEDGDNIGNIKPLAVSSRQVVRFLSLSLSFLFFSPAGDDN